LEFTPAISVSSAVLGLIDGLPQIIGDVIPVVGAIKDTLNNVAAKIQANEKMHPQFSTYLATAENAFAASQATYDTYKAAWSPAFNDVYGKTLVQVRGTLASIRKLVDPVTKGLLPKAEEVIRAFIGFMKDVEKQGYVSDAFLKTAPVAAENTGQWNNAYTAAQSMAWAFGKFNSGAWQAELDASQQPKPVYDNFGKAMAGFDNAIAKLDTVLNAFKALQAAIAD
jgi:hypothetical protein